MLGMNRIAVIFVCLSLGCILTGAVRAGDRRSEGMPGGERILTQVTTGPLADDAAFYRSIERRLIDGADDLRFGDLLAARLNLKWAEARLSRHGASADAGLAGRLAETRSYIRHRQIGMAVSTLHGVIAEVHRLGWTSTTPVEVPVSRRSSTDPAMVKALDELIANLENDETSRARSGLMKLAGGSGGGPAAPASTAKAGRSTLSSDELRILKNLAVHFDDQSYDRAGMISLLRRLRKKIAGE